MKIVNKIFGLSCGLFLASMIGFLVHSHGAPYAATSPAPSNPDSSLQASTFTQPKATQKQLQQAAPTQPTAKPKPVATPAPRYTQPATNSYKAPVCTYRSIPYKTVYKDASWLDKGQTSSMGSGLDGSEKICSSPYGGAPTVTTVVSPYDKTIYVGTREPYNYSSSYSGYYNSAGSYIPSPSYSGATTGGYSPTAVCRDGTYSYSQSRSGTCSSHGGVSSWL
jgi:hypothetical protein